MGDAESLLLILTVIYLVECLVWVPRGSVVFNRWWGRFHQLRHPGNLLGNRRGGLGLAVPFPSLGNVFICQQLPWSLSPKALFSYSALCLDPLDRQRHGRTFHRWDDIQTIAVVGKDILVDGKHFTRHGSPSTARFLARWLEKIRAADASGRSEEIGGFLRSILDLDEIKRRWQTLNQTLLPLRTLSNVAFVYLFGLAPWLLWRHGWIHVGWWLLGGMFLQTLVITWLFWRAHRSLFPEATDDRFKHVLTMMLAPPAALRAPDQITRVAFEPFHPLAVARLLLSPPRFLVFARQFSIDLSYPLLPACPTEEPAAQETEQWFRRMVSEVSQTFLQEQDIKLEELMAPPEAAEPSNRTYCPRCRTQFTREMGNCSDCGGRSLVSLSV